MYNFDIAGLREYLIAVYKKADTAAKDKTNSYSLQQYYKSRAHLSGDLIKKIDICYFYTSDPVIIKIERKDKDVPK